MLHEESVGPNRAQRRKAMRTRKSAAPVEPPAGKLALSVPETAWSIGVSVNTVWNLIADERTRASRLTAVG